MKHKSMQIVAYAYHDEQTSDQRTNVETHLDVCRDCRDYVAYIQIFLQHLRENAEEPQEQKTKVTPARFNDLLKNGELVGNIIGGDIKTGEVRVRDTETGKIEVFKIGEYSKLRLREREVARDVNSDTAETTDTRTRPLSRKRKDRAHGDE
jgi:hypothetical protein